MKPKFVLITVAVTLLILGAMVGIGAAVDASDGSIDAFNDDKWAATGGDGLLEPGDPGFVSEAADISPSGRELVRAAYDRGVASYEREATEICSTMTRIHDEAVNGMNGIGEGSADFHLNRLAEVRDMINNDWLGDIAASNDLPAEYVITGFWDELARDCPEALFTPTIVGRP